MEEMDHMCSISHMSHLTDRSDSTSYVMAMANETLPKAFV